MFALTCIVCCVSVFLSGTVTKPPAQADLVHSSLMLKQGMASSPAPERPTVVATKLGDSDNPDVIPVGHCQQPTGEFHGEHTDTQ